MYQTIFPCHFLAGFLAGFSCASMLGALGDELSDICYLSLKIIICTYSSKKTKRIETKEKPALGKAGLSIRVWGFIKEKYKKSQNNMYNLCLPMHVICQIVSLCQQKNHKNYNKRCFLCINVIFYWT